ncbi:MAG: hypothetical protein R3F60_03750 [bacterium]
MGNATVFFRVFDIAFFAPGLVILVPLWRWWDLDLGRGGSASVLDAAVGAALWFRVAYGVGMVVQGLSRIVLAFTGKALPDPDDAPIWLSVLTLAKREELLLYFWYMRATCLNVAIATPIAVGLWLAVRYEAAFGQEGLGALGALGSAFVLWNLGRSFERSWRRARDLPPPPPALAGPPAPPAGGA